MEEATSINAQGKTIPHLLDKPHEFHGSTDGLILLRLARKLQNGGDVKIDLDSTMNEMFSFVTKCTNDEVVKGISPLPGVLDTLQTLSGYTRNKKIACGLVTGNVEGIARRKMQALGIHDTNVFTPLSQPQGGRTWEGVEDIRFLGGYGSDFCSGSIDDPDRNYLDRGEQISIVVQRCIDLSSTDCKLDRVIHVGDAPADILAAKSYVDHPNKPPGLCVSVVGVATGSYDVYELQTLVGDTIPGQWEPVILEEGQGVGNEEVFLKACGLL